MTKNLMLAIVALLGFSTACSTVKNTAKESKDSAKDSDSVIVRKYAPDTMRRVVVMYGVPVYKLDSAALQRSQQGIGADELTPVTESPREEDTPHLDKSSSQPAE